MATKKKSAAKKKTTTKKAKAPAVKFNYVSFDPGHGEFFASVAKPIIVDGNLAWPCDDGHFSNHVKGYSNPDEGCCGNQPFNFPKDVKVVAYSGRAGSVMDNDCDGNGYIPFTVDYNEYMSVVNTEDKYDGTSDVRKALKAIFSTLE